MKSYRGETLTVKKSEEAICSHYCAVLLALFKRDSFMSLFVQILSCLLRQADVSANNAMAIGLCVIYEIIHT